MERTVPQHYLNPENREVFVSRILADKRVTNYERCLQRRDGTPVWVLLNATLLDGTEGAEPTVEGTIIDITERKAVEEALKHATAAAEAANLTRLRRIEGQIRGLQKMVEADRYCADVLTQISAVCKALHAVGTEVLRNHLRHCATEAIQAGPKPAERMYDELIDLMNRNKC